MFTRKQIDRIYSNIDIGNKDECWDWKRSQKGMGIKYGQISLVDINGHSRNWLAHRLVWTINYGPIPNGLHVLHTCDNPKCCNSNHLFLGTRQDNMDDMVSKGRSPYGVKNGNVKLSEDQVRLIKFEHRNVEANLLIELLYLPCKRGTIYNIRCNRSWKHIT